MDVPLSEEEKKTQSFRQLPYNHGMPIPPDCGDNEKEVANVPKYGPAKAPDENYGSDGLNAEHSECCPCPPSSAGGMDGPLIAEGGVVGAIKGSSFLERVSSSGFLWKVQRAACRGELSEQAKVIEMLEQSQTEQQRRKFFGKVFKAVKKVVKGVGKFVKQVVTGVVKVVKKVVKTVAKIIPKVVRKVVGVAKAIFGSDRDPYTQPPPPRPPLICTKPSYWHKVPPPPKEPFTPPPPGVAAKAAGEASAEEFPYQLAEPHYVETPTVTDSSCCPCPALTLQTATLTKSRR